MTLIYSILIAFFLDIIFGDPYGFPHPVIYIGKFITWMENLIRRNVQKKNFKKFGAGLLLSTVSISFLTAYLVTGAAYRISLFAGIFVEGFILYTTFSVKCLKDEAIKIYEVVNKGDLKEARKALSYIVGRDTNELEFDDINRAVIETVAENTVDGFIAPLLYGLIGGAPLAIAYKAINTLDSMVGYKNEKYMDLGFFSAKTDDIANFIPARLSPFFFSIGALFLGYDYKNAFKISIRDRKNHSSPNSALSEGAVAGALGIQLGGTNIYFGVPVFKPTIGDKTRKIDSGDIKKTCKLMYGCSISSIIVMTVIFILKESMI